MIKNSLNQLVFHLFFLSTFGLLNDITAQKIYYDFSKPTSIYTLPPALNEISGLSYESNTDHFIAINDEQGLIFLLDHQDFNIVETRAFGNPGDYEGVALIQDTVYVVKNSGSIYPYLLQSRKSKAVLKNKLSTTNDVEGICYDITNNSLLLCCKGSPALKNHPKSKSKKAVYSYDLQNKKLKGKAHLFIKDDDLQDYLKKSASFQQKPRRKREKLLKRVKAFAPSGIAIHPLEDKYYILSFHGHLLIKVNRNEKIDSITFLDKSVHTQPESICFDSDYNLYIGNEAQNGLARIIKYSALLYSPSKGDGYQTLFKF